MITLQDLNDAAPGDFVASLASIYEHSPWVAEEVATTRPFASLAALHAAMEQSVRAASTARQLALINAHPDLAGKLARAAGLTDFSAAEQSGIGLDRLNDSEFARFHSLNDSYRARFGFPFIICVRRHTRASVLRQFERRLHHDAAQEQATALNEITRIAALRLDQAVQAPDRLAVHGRLSTHVLDTHGGRPAPGISVTLFEVEPDGTLFTRAQRITNADGRTDSPLISGQPLPIGTYELRFSIGVHYAGLADLPDPPFLDEIPLRFSIAEPEGHYHVPLLMTPWSYATYRGS